MVLLTVIVPLRRIESTKSTVSVQVLEGQERADRISRMYALCPTPQCPARSAAQSPRRRAPFRRAFADRIRNLTSTWPRDTDGDVSLDKLTVILSAEPAG